MRPELRLQGGEKTAETLAEEVVLHLEQVGVIPVLDRTPKPRERMVEV